MAITSLSTLMVLDLARCEWIERKENMIALGLSGIGKTHVALAPWLRCLSEGTTRRLSDCRRRSASSP